MRDGDLRLRKIQTWAERMAIMDRLSAERDEARRWKAVFDLAFEECCAKHQDDRHDGFRHLVSALFKLLPACEKVSSR